jgi:pimeloyl-ACP methyl ester carboxylesterase
MAATVTSSTPENSTIVRASNPPKTSRKRGTSLSLRLTRAGLRVLSPHAPALAAAWAERLFLTARRHRRPAWEQEALATAKHRRVAHKGGWIPTWTWSPNKKDSSSSLFAPQPKTVILVHGWEGRGSQLSMFVAPLLEQGFRVVAFDAPGHGDSTLSKASVVEHARALCAVARAVGPVHSVIGHSVGGAAALFATRIGLEAERFVLISPPTSPSKFAAMFGRFMQLEPGVHSAMIRRLEDRYEVPMTEIDARLDAVRLHTPILVIHDREDPVVAFEEGRAIVNAAPRGELVETQGLGHNAILRSPSVIRRATGFVGGASSSEEDDLSFAETLDGELFCRDRRYVR